MASIDLTLEQVTFDERDLSDDQELDSFSNVVSYDLEWKDKKKLLSESALPTFREKSPGVRKKKTFRKVNPFPFTEENTTNDSLSNSRNLSPGGEDGIISVNYQLYFDEPVATSKPVVKSDIFVNSDLGPTSPEKRTHTSPKIKTVEAKNKTATNCSVVRLTDEASEDKAENCSPVLASPSVNESQYRCPRKRFTGARVHTSAFTPLNLGTVNDILAKLKKSAEMDQVQSPGAGEGDNPDIFTAFATTSEALALQKSVIGNSGVQPATSEEVAKILAETQRKLNLSSDAAIGAATEPLTASNAAEAVTPTASASGDFPISNDELVNNSVISDTDSNSSGLIRITANEIQVTNSKGESRLYKEPHADLKAKLMAKAKANSKSSSAKTKLKKGKKSQKKREDLDNVHRPVKGDKIERQNGTMAIGSPQTDGVNVRKSPHAGSGSTDEPATVLPDKKTVGGDISDDDNSAFAPVRAPYAAKPGGPGGDAHSSLGVSGDELVPKGPEMDHPTVKGGRGRDHTPPVKDPGFQPIINPNDYPLHEALEIVASVGAKNAAIDIQSMEKGEEENNASNLQSVPLSTSTPATTPGKPRSGQPDFHGQGQERSYGLGLFNLSGGFLKRQPGRVDKGGSDLDKVLREKAHLEGQIEMLKMEAASAVRERAELQAQLGALKSQLKSQATSSAGTFKDRDSLLGDIRTLKQRRDELENNISLIQKSLDEKTAENQALSEDLELTKSANSRLQEKIGELRKEIQVKESTIQELKVKILDLNQDLQSIRQEKRQCENEIRSVENEIGALSKTKEWYQQQLKVAQDARTQLQKELSKHQLQMMEQANLIERLKSDGAQVKQQLAETQQKAMQEKELLADHLEKIQADMLEREATFHQLQSEQNDTEETLQQKIQRVEEEKFKLAHLVSTTSDLEQELLKARHELEQKESQVTLLEQEHAAMLKKLTLSQESIAQGQKDYETLESKFVETDARLKEFQNSSNEKEEEILVLKEQKAALEVALSAANDEKRSFDLALGTLRQDFGRVESSFRQMKQEMNKKSLHLEQIEKEKEDLISELDRTKDDLQTQQTSFDEFNSTVSGKFLMVNELQEEKQKLENEIAALKREMQTLNESMVSIAQEKSLVEEELHKAEAKVSQLASELNHAVEEKALLESRIETLTKEKENQSVVSQENETLKTYVQEFQTQAYGEIARYQQEVQRLTQDISNLQKEATEANERHKSDMAALSERFSEALQAQTKAENEVAELNRKIAEGELSSKEEEYLREQIQSLLEKIELLQQKKSALEEELENARESSREEVRLHRERITQLEQQLQQAEELFLQQQESQQENRQLALDLEREKGRLAGVLQSHAALKQHTSELEGALAQKESSIVEISARTQHELDEMSRLAQNKDSLLDELTDGVTKEKDNVKDLKKQLAQEKLRYSKLRNQSEALKLDHGQLQKDFELVKSDFENFKKNIDSGRTGEMKYKAELETLKTEYRITQLEVESLQRQLSQNHEKGPVIDETIKTLHWQIEQKDQEVKGLRERLNLAEQRQELEFDNAKKALQATKEEVDKLRAELSQTRKEKFTYQAKLSELRGAVKASLKGKNAVKSSVKDEACQPDEDFPYTSALSIIEKILQDNTLPTYNSKPLAALQQCLGSLRSEMTNLQKQIDDHTMAVFNSTQSWRQVESHVADLKQLCHTQNGNASSEELSSSNAKAEQEIQRLIAEDMRAKSKERQIQAVDI